MKRPVSPRVAKTLSVVSLALGALSGCGQGEVMRGNKPATAAADGGAKPSASAGRAEEAPKADFQEAEFGESERSRDPFRAFADLAASEERGRLKSQRKVLLDQYSLDELKLVGIVTRIHPAEAMLVDPTGRGHVIRRGQFVGRPEVVQAAGQSGTSYEVNWRVDDIREGDVVFVREDPQNPDVPSSTKVIPLRPEGTIILGQ